MDRDRIYSLAVQITGDGASAMDLTQQAFVTAWARLDQFREESNIKTWLYRLMLNLHRDERRRIWRRHRMMELFARTVPAEVPSSDHRLQEDEVAACVAQAMERLRPKLRLPLTLRYTNGLSYPEIAEVLGCSAGTVASRLNRAHKEMARRLSSLRPVLMGGD